MKKLLVTGGAGFIGSWFVKSAVEKGYEVVVLDALTYAGDLERLKKVKDNVSFHQTDITDINAVEEIFKKENPDIVVHFAAESHVDRSIIEPSIFIKTNVEGTFNLLETAKKYSVEKFINISTDEVYGELENLEDQFTEETCLKPNSPYSSSKASADMLGRAYYKTYNLPVITVRPSNNYGPWQYPEKFIPVIILKALQNEPIPVYGTGKNRREWIFVKDCAEGVLTVMEKGRIGEIYNLGSGEEKENIEVVKTILKILGKPENLISFVKDRPGHDLRYRMNSEKIKKELGFTPKTTFEEGIKQTIEFYIENMDWVKQKEKELQNLWQKVYR
ncbi:MAG: dTDP-glucose 4,6-dehydratase [Hydrogenothermaceae bacterium]